MLRYLHTHTLSLLSLSLSLFLGTPSSSQPTSALAALDIIKVFLQDVYGMDDVLSMPRKSVLQQALNTCQGDVLTVVVPALLQQVASMHTAAESGQQPSSNACALTEALLAVITLYMPCLNVSRLADDFLECTVLPLLSLPSCRDQVVELCAAMLRKTGPVEVVAPVLTQVNEQVVRRLANGVLALCTAAICEEDYAYLLSLAELLCSAALRHFQQARWSAPFVQVQLDVLEVLLRCLEHPSPRLIRCTGAFWRQFLKTAPPIPDEVSYSLSLELS
jgi:hypothetical protein